jgi:hypothetical protein
MTSHSTKQQLFSVDTHEVQLQKQKQILEENIPMAHEHVEYHLLMNTLNIVRDLVTPCQYTEIRYLTTNDTDQRPAYSSSDPKC